ncbi:MAG: VCBS repeat-containing protein, partial [Planctomycetota bacterium]|nr:VCBS repeat-containing protein [Planctomycetota bacterium]
MRGSTRPHLTHRRRSTILRIAHRFVVVSLAGSVLAGVAAAQFGNEWVSFHEDTNGRLDSSPDLGDSDIQEKDYAWADLDQDGWTDLVVARKQPYTTTGKRVNVLFMNQSGVLRDRTAAFASASDVPGDLGFLQPTNDRDVVIADVDQDGWLDVVTATALGFSDPKHISHPRVYRNLGSSGGSWLGLLHEDARFPQLFTSAGSPKAPAFCSVAAGDVTGNGYPDLHFTDYDTGGAGGANDLNDRLLINDGAGFFVDESFLRMTSSMLVSDFGTSSEIVDLNLNGIGDIVKNEDGDGEAFYNDPTNIGFFNILHDIQDGSPYFVSTGDLNNDGRIDVIWSDDGSDRYRYNTGTDLLER